MKGRYLRLALAAYALPALVVGAIWGWTARSDDRFTGQDIWTLALMPLLFIFFAGMIEDGIVNSSWFKAEQRRDRRSRVRRSGSERQKHRSADDSEIPWMERRYGERHREMRAHWRGIVDGHGATCSERVCVLPSRRITRGAPFDLAHDHEAGGDRDYLGPAHPECNRAEAEARLGYVPGNQDGALRVSPNASEGGGEELNITIVEPVADEDMLDEPGTFPSAAEVAALVEMIEDEWCDLHDEDEDEATHRSGFDDDGHPVPVNWLESEHDVPEASDDDRTWVTRAVLLNDDADSSDDSRAWDNLDDDGSAWVDDPDSDIVLTEDPGHDPWTTLARD